MRSRSVVRESRSARVSGIPSATRLPAPSLNPAVSSLLAAASSPLQSTANQRPAPRCLPRRRLPGPYTSSGSRHSSSTRKLQSDPDDVVEARRSDVTAPPELSKLWAARCEQTEASAEEERVRQGMKDDLITAKATRRSVRLEVRPKPMTLQQTRRILQEMGRYGEVVSYRSQRFKSNMNPACPNQWIYVIYRDLSSVERLLSISPLKITLPVAVNPPEQLSRWALEDSPGSPPEAPASTARSEHGTYTIDVQTSDIDHRNQIIWWPQYGGFVPNQRSAEASHLHKMVPLRGLDDCMLGRWGGKLGVHELPTRIVNRRKDDTCRPRLVADWEPVAFGWKDRRASSTPSRLRKGREEHSPLSNL